MLSRKLLPLLAVLPIVGVGSARAQVSIYGMVSGQRFGGVTCPSFAAPCAANSGDAHDFGGSFGLMYDFRSFGVARLGVDARGAVLSSNKRADSSAGGVGVIRQYEALAGPRVSFSTPITWLHPYAEFLVGYTRNNASGLYTENTTTDATVTPPTTLQSLNFNPSVFTSQAMFEGVIGVDLHVAPRLHIRPIEVGLGDAFGSSNTVVATTTTTSGSGATSSSTVLATSPSSHGIATISAGLVLHF